MGTEITERYQREDFRNIFNSVKQRKIQFGYNSRWHSDHIWSVIISDIQNGCTNHKGQL